MAQNENISLSLTNKIDILNKTQSVDARYGVYDNESDALSAMLSYGLDGRLVAVYTDKINGKVKVYKYNQVLHQLDPIDDQSLALTLEQARTNDNTVEGVILGSGEFDKQGDRTAFIQLSDLEDALTAYQVSYNNISSDLDADNVQDAIDELRGLDLNDFTNNTLNRYIRLDETLVKLEESMTFTVGVGKDFETISEAIDQALNYYPNEDYKITILIDEGFEIEESFHYQGLDFSHMIFSTTGEIILTSTPASIGSVNPLFYFNSCWLPSFQDFKLIKSDSLTTAHIVGLRTSSCASGYLSNTDWLKFATCLWFEQTSNFYIENTLVKPYRTSSIRRGVRMQNSHIDIRSINTDTYPEDPYYDSNNNVAIECLSSSTLHMRQQGGTTSINGSFKIATHIGQGSQLTITTLTEVNIDGDYDILINGGIFYNNITASIGNNITVNIPYNTVTELGLALKSTKPVPYKFNGTDYLLDYIKAPSGQEYNVTVDDTGKLISEPKPTIPEDISELNNDAGYTTNTGTVTSVGLSVPTGLSISGSPVTTSGTLAVTYDSGYQGYTIEEASKLSGIEDGAEVNVQSDWNAVSGDAMILNKPTIPAQLNPTPGTGISITGTYPNLTFTNTSPNVAQNLHQTTTLGNVTSNNVIVGDDKGRNITLSGDGQTITIGTDGSLESLILNKDSIKIRNGNGFYNSIVNTEAPTQNNQHQLQNKSGIIAHTDDVSPDIKFITNADNNFTLSTTKSSMIVTANISAITIVRLPELTEGLIIYVTNKGSVELKLVTNAIGDIWDEGTTNSGFDILPGTTAKLVCDGVHYVLFK